MSWLDTLEQIQSRDFSEATEAERDEASRDLINMASYACAGVAVVPLPFSDAVLMMPIQTAMVVAIGHVQGRKVTKKDATRLIGELAALAGVSFLARQGIKALLPVFGAMLTMPAAFAANWAIGRVALEYFKHPDTPKEQLKGIYERAREEGKRMFSREKLETLRKQEAAAPKNEAKVSRAPKRPTAARKAKKRAPRRSSARRTE